MNGPQDEAFIKDPGGTDPRRAGESWPEYRVRTGTKPGCDPQTISNAEYARLTRRSQP